MLDLTPTTQGTPWTDLLTRHLFQLVLDGASKSNGLAPCASADWMFVDPYDPDHVRLIYLNALVEDGQLLPATAVELFEDPTLPLTDTESVRAYVKDALAFRAYDITERPNEETFEKMRDDELGHLVMEGEDMRFVTVGPDFSETAMELDDKLAGLFAPFRFHLLLVRLFDDNDDHFHAWGVYEHLDKLARRLCRYDEETYFATFEIDRALRGEIEYEDVFLTFDRENAYKGGGFSCIN